jgi:hypothetical protein
MPSGRDLAAVRQRSAQARNVIENLFLDAIVAPRGNLVAWGQYLDLRKRQISNQFGIYGTSAGIQVLLRHNAALHAELCGLAGMILPVDHPTHDVFERPASEIRTYFREKHDLEVLYKVAALVDVVEAQRDSVPGTGYRAVQLLLAMRRPNAGWPDFRGNGGLDQFTDSKVHATACALLALARFPDVRAGTAWREAAGWLVQHLDPDVQSIATLSICHLALWSGDERPAGIADDEADARAACLRSIVDWAERTAPQDVLRTLEALEYLVPQRNQRTPLADHEFTFVLYSPHCLAALALIRSGLPLSRKAERFVVEVVWVVAERIRTHGSFVAAGRTLVSSVEHLWIYRLLHQFEQWRPKGRFLDNLRR